MNVRSRAFYSLSAALLLAGCGAVMERRISHIDRKWPAGAIRHIEVREIDVRLGRAEELERTLIERRIRLV